MNLVMWGRALHGIPRISKAQWDDLDVVARWLIVTRAAVIIMTLTSACIAGLLAFRAGKFDGAVFGLVALGLVLAHATNNMINDLTDSWKGVDKGNYFRTQYGPQPLEHGLMTVRQLMLYIVITGVAALAVAGYLVYLRGPIVLALAASGAFFVLFYTFPLKYIGLGEVAVVLVWGPLMIGGGYYTITGEWDWNVSWIALPHALAATTVLFGKHIDKLLHDKAKKVRTLPVLMGHAPARLCVIAMMVAQYGIVAALVISGAFSPFLLVVFLAANWLWTCARIYSKSAPEERPDDFPDDVWPLWYSAHAFVHTRRFGILFLVGLIADAAWRVYG